MRSAPLVIAITLVVGALAASPAEAQRFRRPFACSSCIANWYYFDEDPADGPTEDWNCAASTYNGHRGSDFSLAGGNGAIDTGYDVVAGADGVVESVQDGHFDHCTACGGTGCGTSYGYGFGNHVVINHGSYKVVYAHMRTGSVRVGPGDTVTCGQTIGQIGSSGCSTGAHLHFETRPLGGAYTTAFDPFEGGCSPTSPSLWFDQGPHRGIPGASCDGTVTPTCPSGTYPIWTCNSARTQRRRCIDGVDMIEDCPYGCTVMAVGTDDVCAPPPDADGDGSPAGTDCDDGNASVHPGATDTCGDGVDQDCAGGDAVCPGMDGGPVPIDGGVPPGQDASIATDGASPGGDGGTVGRDASSRADGGGSGDTELAGGCGCRVGAGAPGGGADRSIAGLALALVALAVRRRRTR